MFKKLLKKIKRKKKVVRSKISLFNKRTKTIKKYTKRSNFRLNLGDNFYDKIIYFYYLLGFSASLALIYFFSISPYFLVKSIKIERQDNASNIEIAYAGVNEFRSKNIFGIDINKIKEKLKNNQENLKEVKVSKKFPKTISVNLLSYKVNYKTIIDNKPYLILENGSLIPGDNEEASYLELKYKNFPKFYEYKIIVDELELKKIKLTQKKIEKNIIGLKIQKINYYINEKEVHFVLKNDTTIIFGLNSDLKAQIEKLAIFNQEHIELTNIILIYIDLRVKNKLFYCDKETEFSCYNNLNYIYGKNR